MSYELKYFPIFVDNLQIWYRERYGTEEKLKIAHTKKIQDISAYLRNEFYPIGNYYKDCELELEKQIPNVIWFLWWQGENSIPPLQQSCINSVKKYAKGYEIKIITKNNYKEYIDIDDLLGYRSQKFLGKERLIIQHFSDIIRMRLLKKYGGIWLDATMLFTDDKTLKLIETLPFFTIRLKELLDNKLLFAPGHGQFCTSFLASYKDNPLFSYIEDCLIYHLNHHKSFWDYFISEYAIVLGMERVPQFKSLFESVPFSNSRMFWLEDKLYNKFNLELWRTIKQSTDSFKLNWRFQKENINNENTYFQFILNNAL